MSLTRIDFNIFRGNEASLVTSSFAALNPTQEAGSLVAAGATAAGTGIGSQVACRLSLEHFVDGVLGFFDKSKNGSSSKSEISLAVLEAAFKNSNTSVYSFGHKLAAGGRMSASLVGLVIHGSVFAAGRVGNGSAYLVRRGEIFPFFENSPETAATAPQRSYLGSQSVVAVELASIPAEANDFVFLCSERLSPANEARLGNVLVDGEDLDSPKLLRSACAQVFEAPEKVPFAMLIRTGPNTIYLKGAGRSAG